MRNFDLTYIIDDDSTFVFVLKKLLKKIENFNEIRNIVNGEEAVTVLENHYSNGETFPDIIFLDINMPMLDGWQFLEEIEQSNYHQKCNIYIVSSTIDVNEIEKSKNYASVKGFISKPVLENKLKDILMI
jgi:response regulator of citrate/malate metabolism